MQPSVISRTLERDVRLEMRASEWCSTACIGCKSHVTSTACPAVAYCSHAFPPLWEVWLVKGVQEMAMMPLPPIWIGSKNLLHTEWPSVTLQSAWVSSEVHLPTLSVKPRLSQSRPSVCLQQGGLSLLFHSQVQSLWCVCMQELEGRDKSGACACFPRSMKLFTGYFAPCKCISQYRNLSLVSLTLCASGKQVSFSGVITWPVGSAARQLPLK